MMQKCPRCGFLQPKDHYCAECGLNIDEYRPKGLAWRQRIPVKPLIFIVFVCFGALLAGVLRRPAVVPTALNNSALQHGIVTPSSQSGTAKKGRDVAHLAPKSTAARSLAPSIDKAAGGDLAQQQSAAGVQPAVLGAVPPPPPARPVAPQAVQLRFLEVPISGLEAAYERGRELQGSANEKALALNFDKNLSELRFMGGFVLPGGAQKHISLKKSARFNFVSAASEVNEESLGLVLQFTMLSFDANELAVELDASLRLQVSENLYTGQLKEVYRLKSSSEVLLLTGFLPRDKNLAAPDWLQTPLNLLQSEDFLNNNTEFALLARFQ